MSIKLEFNPRSEEPREIIEWARRQHDTLTILLNEGMERFRLAVLHVEPEKPRDGNIIYADGSDWDPGAGEGFYGYENGAWVKL